MRLSFAYSPCPNDTFMFYDVAAGNLRLPDHRIGVCMDDVETLNRLAIEGRFDVTKVSFHAYLMIQDQYELLSSGAALGFGCGPLVVSKRDLSSSDLPRARFAIPGELTTANMLLRLWRPEATNTICARYDEIMGMVTGGEADAGVIIHEGRFTYAEAGLRQVVDLGRWWEEETRMPIPLGCIVARKDLGPSLIARVDALLRQSIANALTDPSKSRDYVRQHAQEMATEVIEKHIHTFVNDFSLDLGEQGRLAVAKLQEMARRSGIVQ